VWLKDVMRLPPSKIADVGREAIEDRVFMNSGTSAARRRPLSMTCAAAAPDPSRLRSVSEQKAIWAAYETLVAHATARLDAVTSEDLVLLAAAPSGGEAPTSRAP
jgi:hypothetical protein